LSRYENADFTKNTITAYVKMYNKVYQTIGDVTSMYRHAVVTETVPKTPKQELKY